MDQAVRVVVPLISPNEPEAQVASVEVAEGASVAEGEILAVVENTKSAVEVEAPEGGYIVGLVVAEGHQVTAGQLICWIAHEAGWDPPAVDVPAGGGADDLPDGLRISGPALDLARSRGVALDALPKGPLVTTAMVEQVAAGGAELRWIGLDHDGEVLIIGRQELGDRALVVYGGGGHGRQLIDAVRGVGGIDVRGVIDDGLAPGDEVLGVQVLGGSDALADLGDALALNAVGGIASPTSRAAVFDRLADAGVGLPAIVHPAAWVEPSARLAAGAQVFAHAYVGSAAVIGAGAIVNTGAVISHDCVLRACANVSPGALLAGGVEVGPMALVGMGVTVNLGVTIGERARIGNGATVKADVPAGAVVRAGEPWPR